MDMHNAPIRCPLRPQLVYGLAILGVVLAGPVSSARADLVEATYNVSAGGFEDSNGASPQDGASTFVSGAYTITFNTAIREQQNISPSDVQGLDISDSDGGTTDYNAFNSGADTLFVPGLNISRITLGGALNSVEFMVGISNDFRVKFDISTTDFSVTGISEQFVYITEHDPFYRSNNTQVQLVAVTVQTDSDNDAIVDTSDNCVLVANAIQRDTDSDAIGNKCDADFNQDCLVNTVDLGIMRSRFFESGDIVTDLNGDSVTNTADLGMLKGLFFRTPGPSGLAHLCDS